LPQGHPYRESPDPSGISLADLTDPQQLNLYTYVRNNPVTLSDPSGLGPEGCLYTIGRDSQAGPANSINDDEEPSECSADGGSVVGGNARPQGCGDTPCPPRPPIPFHLHTCQTTSFLCLDIYKIFQSPQKPTFTRSYLPSNAQTCSAILQFPAPPGFDLNKIVKAGRAGGLLHAGTAVGHSGTFDFQRVTDSAGNTTFYSGYTQASNIAVGAYLYGAGYSEGNADRVANAYSLATRSSNALGRNQRTNIDLGYDLAKAGWNPSCKAQ
jgi:hypothetical protein